MRSAIREGVWRDRAIYQAAQLGVGSQAIAEAIGVTRQTIYRILVLQGAPERELKQRARKRHQEKQRVFRPAMDAQRSGIARGLPRDRLIVKAAGAGLAYAAIGREVGLTRERVRQIVVKHQMLVQSSPNPCPLP
jgi:predicted transcriptional regulator